MNIVLDTNILLVSISDRSPYHLIFKAFVEQRYTLCVTTDILDEYAEILAQHTGERLANHALETIENAPNVRFVTRYYAFGLIEADPDDNKFVDCAIASNATHLVTNDGHFNVLKAPRQPLVSVISIQEFMDVLKQ